MLRDWVPFYVALTVYDSLRGAANNWLMPHALPQIHIDRALFGGEVPTVQLQHALYTPGVAHVWDYAAFGVYMTHFIVPFVIAGVLWHFNHERFRRFTFLFLTLTFSAFITYALYPAVPPWLAAQNQQIQPTAKIIDEMWAHIGLANGSDRVLGHRALRESGGGGAVTARGVPDADLPVLLAARPPAVARAPRALPARDGLHAGVHRRALRDRRPPRVALRGDGLRRGFVDLPALARAASGA